MLESSAFVNTKHTASFQDRVWVHRALAGGVHAVVGPARDLVVDHVSVIVLVTHAYGKLLLQGCLVHKKIPLLGPYSRTMSRVLW